MLMQLIFMMTSIKRDRKSFRYTTKIIDYWYKTNFSFSGHTILTYVYITDNFILSRLVPIHVYLRLGYMRNACFT